MALAQFKFKALVGLASMSLIIGCQGAEFSDGQGIQQRGAVPADEEATAEQPEEAVTTGRTVLDPPEGLELQEFMVTENLKPVDIFFVMDTSGSMVQEKADLEASMNGFIKALNTGMIDAKVTAVGSTTFRFPADISADKFRVINQTVGSINAIGVMNRVFAAGNLPLPLRDDAKLEIIFISDDNGRGAGNLATDFKAPKPAVVSGIVGLKQGQDAQNANCSIVNVGQEYMNAAKASGGSVFDLCTRDWSAMLKKLSEKIQSRNRGFKLEKKRKSSGRLSVKIADRSLDKSEFDFDAALNAIILKDTVELQVGAKVLVEFEKE